MTVYLDGWSFDGDELASARTGHRLLNPSLDLGSACNLNCPYCFIEEKNSARKERKPGELSPDEVEAVVRDFLSAGARTVNLVGAGEPTVDPQFRDIVDLIHSGRARTVVFTNGIALADDAALIEWL
jgi:molybdenum cofactor biosynthesis enzyme MoaA